MTCTTPKSDKLYWLDAWTLSANLWAEAQPVQATLAGHALLPVTSAVSTPKDAPSDLQQSGKYTSGKRVTELGSVAGKSADRLTGLGLPINGQPLQGHSGIKTHARRYLLGC
ncbi:Uncharacterised protein [Escherichia coli]|uniref:Uncharacterized protein n=1 Tax=Escherichia coli TaxID=562 RepID=A0A377HHQ1_ECOLX|nr:Uncharacterised protein [Escherichia coli]